MLNVFYHICSTVLAVHVQKLIFAKLLALKIKTCNFLSCTYAILSLNVTLVYYTYYTYFSSTNYVGTIIYMSVYVYRTIILCTKPPRPNTNSKYIMNINTHFISLLLWIKCMHFQHFLFNIIAWCVMSLNREKRIRRILRTINYKLVVSCNNTICNLFIVVRSLSALRGFIVYLTYSNVSISIKWTCLLK